MLKKLLLSFALVLAFQAFTAAEAEAACGGPFEVPCYRWDWCAYTTPSIFGDVCWGGFVPTTAFGGCDNNRLNNWALICVPCGSEFEPTCQRGPVCDTDRRFTPFALCIPCGQTGEAACTTGAACDVGNRAVFGFCSYSGFSAEPTTNVQTMPTLTQPATGPVRGIAELHAHQFSNLGFGGALFWGAPYDDGGINAALPWCDYTWEFSIFNEALNLPAPVLPFLGVEAHGPKDLQPVTHVVSNGIPEGSHHVAGTGPFDGWPTYNTYTHQQMYHKWVERAFQGGLRLMVLHMVSNEAICEGSKRRSDFTCNDMDAVDLQLQAAKDLEQAIDRMDDNQTNNSGWYRIAYSPSQARSLIRAGKMAVVLGIEVDSLFDCKPNSAHCTEAFLRSELERYYSMGIRHVFPIHQFNNAFGGAAVFRDELNAGNAVVTGNHFTVRDCSAQGYDYNVEPSTVVDIFSLVVQGIPLPDADYYAQFAADCNSLGLTTTGEKLIAQMMDLKFIIDIDHMSRPMTDSVLALARATTETRPNKYPLVSSHTGFLALKEAGHRNEFTLTEAQVAIMKEIGGVVTANNPKGDCSTTRDFAEAYHYAVARMKKDDADQFPGVAFSTDMNGFAGSTAPRFGAQSCPGGNPNDANAADINPLPYPFNGILGGSFNRQVTGDRTFDFNNEGLAHYGMLADFFADLKRTGMTDAELDPLLNSAETYIRMWEAIDNSDKQPPPTVTAVITGTLGNNGWYRSNVALTWEITTAEGATAVLTNCGPQNIMQDTPGVTFTCTAKNSGTNETATKSVTIRRDATPPTYNSARMTPTPATGWTNQDVRIRFAAGDALSGLPNDGLAEVLMNHEGGDQTATRTFVDRAGNATIAAFGGINIDKTRPDIGFRFKHLPDNATPAQIVSEQQRWHTQPVTLLVDARDTLSGIQSVTQTQLVFAVQGVNLTSTVGATDRAGNSVVDTSDPIRIDLTPPTVLLQSRQPLGNAQGWNRTDVTTTWLCLDSLSGPAQPTVFRTLTGEGLNQTASQTCADIAGNTTPATLPGINIDKTPPVITYSDQQPPANANGWNNSPVAIPFAITDTLSGVSSTSTPSPLHFTAQGGAVNGNVIARDRADNQSQLLSPAVNIDLTPPSIAFVDRLPLANTAGWNKSDITIRWTCEDGLSGASSANIAETLSVEGAGRTLTGRCTDRADNFTSDARGGLNLDKTAPTLDYAVQSPLANVNGWNNTDVAFAFTPSDNLSGVATTSIPSPLVFSTESAGINGTVTVVDVADNAAAFTSPTVRIDKTAPTLVYADQAPPANGNGWNNTDVAFGFTPADGLSGVAGTSIPSPLVLSAEGAAVNGTVTVTDLADNAATFTSSSVRIDKTAPLIECAAGPNYLWPPNNQMVNVTVAMTFTDGLSGAETFSFTGAASNEPGDDDIAAFTLGAPDLSGQLRAQREGRGNGRRYTLGYLGVDFAGNTSTCSTAVVAPHDSSGLPQQ